MINIIGFDAEFAIKEILELSIHRIEAPRDWTNEGGKLPQPSEVFHQFFKPRTERNWRDSIRVHHITPRMVAHRPPISRFDKPLREIIGTADVLVGFDIKNDIEALKGEGYDCFDDKAIIDVKDLFWLLRGRFDNIPLDSRKGLEATAETLEIEFSGDKAHGASYDTLITMLAFGTLFEEYASKYPDLTLDRLISTYQEDWEKASDDYLREYAKGYVALIPAPDGYKIKSTRENHTEGAEEVIRVNARFRALDEIDAHFNKRRVSGKKTVYRLREEDLRWFRQYKNEYDGNERLHKDLHKLRMSTAI